MIIRKFRAELRQGSIDVGMIQDQGARERQEDTAGFTELPEGERPEVFGAVVADGMGGMASGALVSSQAAADLLAEDIRTPEELAAAFRKVSNEISSGGTKGGTTLAAVYCLPGGVHFCSSGDSRVYRLRDGILTQLTADQDYMSLLLDRVIGGSLSFAQAEQDPERDSLVQFIGSGALISPDMNFIPLSVEPGDRLLICTDGVYNALSVQELMQSLTLSAGGAAEDILGRVLSRGYSNQDNFTAVVLAFLTGWENSQQAEPEAISLHADLAFHIGLQSEKGEQVRAAAERMAHGSTFSADDLRVYYYRSGKLLTAVQGEPIQAHPGDAFLVCTESFARCVFGQETEIDLIKSRSAEQWLSYMLKRHLLRSHDIGGCSAACGIFVPGEGTKPERKRPVHLPMIIGLGTAAVALAGLAAALIYLVK